MCCPTAEPPLLWEVTVRRWLGPGQGQGQGQQLGELRPDPCVWEEWDMQVSGIH